MKILIRSDLDPNGGYTERTLNIYSGEWLLVNNNLLRVDSFRVNIVCHPNFIVEERYVERIIDDIREGMCYCSNCGILKESHLYIRCIHGLSNIIYFMGKQEFDLTTKIRNGLGNVFKKKEAINENISSN